mmetsp:Transcript_14543/g.20341  ORF Transcript_14543/g.20341 Transcript_14543/m.20341 type:complete len:225 (+) Transcript_14543:25-699(+)
MALKALDLETLSKHVNGLSNKDKVIKIFQYGAQALQHYVFTDATDPRAQKINTLFWSLVLHRKLFRYMNSLSEIVNIKKRLQEISSDDPNIDKVNSVLLLGKNSSFFVFWLLDNAVYLSMGKLVKFNAGPAALLSYKLWLFANICNMLRNIRLYSNCRGDKQRSKDLELAIVKDVADIVVALGFSKMADPYISWGQIGLAGVLSALLHLHLAWPRVYHNKPKSQ